MQKVGVIGEGSEDASEGSEDASEGSEEEDIRAEEPPLRAGYVYRGPSQERPPAPPDHVWRGVVIGREVVQLLHVLTGTPAAAEFCRRCRPGPVGWWDDPDNTEVRAAKGQIVGQASCVQQRQWWQQRPQQVIQKEEAAPPKKMPAIPRARCLRSPPAQAAAAAVFAGVNI